MSDRDCQANKALSKKIISMLGSEGNYIYRTQALLIHVPNHVFLFTNVGVCIEVMTSQPFYKKYSIF